MAKIEYANKGSTRDRPLTATLERVLAGAADVAGIDVVRIISGGQPSRDEGGRRTGSTRHDHGAAADLQLLDGARKLTFTDRDAPAQIKAFVEEAAALGATGLGAGERYMGRDTMHVGFGSRAIWGAGGRSVNAPRWLERAVRNGWARRRAPASERTAPHVTLGGHVVTARNGLILRGGPSVSFKSLETLAAGSFVDVIAYDGASAEWARVDLQGDGQVDGHVFAAFLSPDAVDHIDEASDRSGDDGGPTAQAEEPAAGRSQRKRQRR